MEFKMVKKNGKKYYFQKDCGTLCSREMAKSLSKKITINGKEYVATLQPRKFWEEISEKKFNNHSTNIFGCNFFLTSENSAWFEGLGFIPLGAEGFSCARLGFVVEE